MESKRNKVTLDFIVAAIVGAPLWVWGVLGYLLFVGLKAMRTRIVYAHKLFIIQAVFIALNYKNLTYSESIIPTLSLMLLGLIIVIVVGHNTPIKISKGIKSIELPGNYSTIIILFLFFIMQYVFGYLQTVQLPIALRFLCVNIYMSALFSGFFLGKAICYLYRFYNDK